MMETENKEADKNETGNEQKAIYNIQMLNVQNDSKMTRVYAAIASNYSSHQSIQPQNNKQENPFPRKEKHRWFTLFQDAGAWFSNDCFLINYI